jgi:hypothetical protein
MTYIPKILKSLASDSVQPIVGKSSSATSPTGTISPSGAMSPALKQIMQFGSSEYEILKKTSKSIQTQKTDFNQWLNFQQITNDYALKMNIVSKVSEAFSTTVRKFQQQ